MIRHLFIGGVLWPLLICAPLWAQVTFSAPETVEHGEAIKFEVDGAEPGDIIQWRLLHPRGVGVKQIETKYGVEHIIDPPVGYGGTIEVLCTVINWKSQKFIQDELIVLVDHGGEPVDPVDPDVPEPDDPEPGKPDPPPDVDIPNELGVGMVAYSAAPDAATAKKVAAIHRAAGEFLYGRPTTKFIASADHPKKDDPDYNVILWLAEEIGKVADSKWSAWADKVAKAFVDSQNANGFYTREMWYEAFNEVADALEQVK